MRAGLVVVVTAALSAVTGCSASTTSPTGPGSAASANRPAAVAAPEAARATAQTEFGLLAGGDFAGAWDLWSPAAKQAISRADFVTLNTLCPPRRGVSTQVVSVHRVDDANVDVAWQLGADSGTARLVYADGAWRYQPDQSILDEYRQGLDHVVAQRRTAGQCPADSH